MSVSADGSGGPAWCCLTVFLDLTYGFVAGCVLPALIALCDRGRRITPNFFLVMDRPTRYAVADTLLLAAAFADYLKSILSLISIPLQIRVMPARAMRWANDEQMPA